MAPSRLTEKLSELAREHQFVAMLGARGTGKTFAAAELQSMWNATGVTVCAVDCHYVSKAEDLLAPIEAVLGTELDRFGPEDAERLQAPVRIVIDSGGSARGPSMVPYRSGAAPSSIELAERTRFYWAGPSWATAVAESRRR